VLTELYSQLVALLAEAGCSAYAADAVPPDAAFPFVTIEARVAATLHGTGRVTLTGWVHGNARHADRLALGDALLKIVPSGGRKLPLTGGYALLIRGDRMNVEWPETQGALGVRVTHGLRVAGGASDA